MKVGPLSISWEINIGEIITFAGLACSVIWFFAAQDAAIKAETTARVNLEQRMTDRQQDITERLNREVGYISASLSDIKATQRRIEDKLDSKADKAR